jgi:Fic family protein
MKWNWQLTDWPSFTYSPYLLEDLEKKFLQGVGGAFAVLKHIEDSEKRPFIVEILCTEGITSAEIEGEVLQRESLQSSIQRHFGFSEDKRKIPFREQGMGNLICNVYDTFDHKLTHEMLYEWHRFLMSENSSVSDIGKYRTHNEPMQIISGRSDKHIIYFEAPPSKDLKYEMERFIDWFNNSRNKSVLARASIVHLYFESIHPFEDGNGRIGRALVEKSLSQSLNQPTLIAVSQMINKRKKEYYAALSECNNNLHVDIPFVTEKSVF